MLSNMNNLYIDNGCTLNKLYLLCATGENELLQLNVTVNNFVHYMKT